MLFLRLNNNVLEDILGFTNQIAKVAYANLSAGLASPKVCYCEPNSAYARFSGPCLAEVELWRDEGGRRIMAIM